MTTINKIQYSARLKRCASGKHKFRENNFGISWCVNCGLLGNINSATEKLTEEDKLIIDCSN